MSSNIEYASVSAIIPCYNSTKTMERAVVSVWEQTLRPKELILVDDGSTDNSLELARVLQQKYGSGFIEIIELGKNMGVSFARNVGWNAAKGDYIALLDSDDSWHPMKLEIQYSFMKNNNQYVLSGHSYSKYQNKNLFNSKILDEFKIKYYSFKYLLLKNPFITPSFMFKNDIEIKFSEYDGGFEDHYFLMKISNRYGQIPSLQLPLASIYKNIYGESGLTSKMWYMQKGYFFIYKELYKSSTITYISYLFLTFYSMIKYIRRLLKVYI